MKWYAPLTILPAVGLIILSSSNLLVGLNNEIYQWDREKEISKDIILEKLEPLNRLGIAISCLYASALFL
jgi:hypothetical protein